MQPDKPKKTKSIKNLIIRTLIITAALVVVIGLAAVVVFFWHKNTLTNQVKSDLNKVATNMQSAHKTGGYPVTVPEISSFSKTTQISGGGSFDGTTYCVTGTSVSDNTIVWHIDSKNVSKGPQSGSCTSEANLPVPSTIGGVAVTLANSTSISLVWNPTTYATSYTLQCSDNVNFESAKDINTTTTAGSCSNLKSGTYYYSRVRAVNKTGDGPWSTTVGIPTAAS